MKKIVLTGGGTGGHVVPHLSLIDTLKKDFEIHYIGTNGIEKEIMKDTPVVYHTISAVKLERDKKLKNLLLPFKLLASISSCKKILKKIKPDIIFSKGGFVSLPVVIAGKSRKIKIISHESDLTIGIANKIIYKYSDVFCTSFEDTAKGLKKAVVTGCPIRKDIFNGSITRGKNITKFNNNKKTLLFMGGSTGAKAINDCVIDSLDLLLKDYNIINIVGKNKGNDIKKPGYLQLEYVKNIEDIFAVTDFIISRAGANAIFEFVALKKPTLLIPLPKGASRGDQVENANNFKQKGLVNVLFQENLNSTTLVSEIKKLEKDKDTLIKNMTNFKYKNGSENILKEIYNFVKN